MPKKQELLKFFLKLVNCFDRITNLCFYKIRRLLWILLCQKNYVLFLSQKHSFFSCNKNVLFFFAFFLSFIYFFIHLLSCLLFLCLCLFFRIFSSSIWHVEREIKIHFEMLARRVFIICKQRCQSCEVNKSIICCISVKSVAFKHSFIKSGQTIVIIFFLQFVFAFHSLDASFRRSESQKVISTTFQFVPCFFFDDAQSPQRSTVYKQHLTTFI